MFVATVIVTVLLAVALTGSAFIKITRREPFVQGYLRVGVPVERLNALAAILLAGAAGLLAGLLWPPLGVLAAACVAVYFLLAIVFHARARDLKNAGAPAAVVVVAVAALVLRAVTW